MLVGGSEVSDEVDVEYHEVVPLVTVVFVAVTVLLVLYFVLVVVYGCVLVLED